jgi:hypothetical protein
LAHLLISIGRGRLPAPYSFLLLRTFKPLFQRIDPCIRRKLWTFRVLIHRHADLLCVALAEVRVVKRENMPATDPAKAPLLYEGGSG